MEIRQMKEQPTLAVRLTTSMEALSEVIGKCYGEVISCLNAKGCGPAGPPFALYYNVNTMDMANLDVEIGFPLASPVPGIPESGIPCSCGTLKPGKLPACRAVYSLYRGPYQDMEKPYKELMAFIAEKGLATESYSWENYLNSPEDTPPENLETEIVFPLK